MSDKGIVKIEIVYRDGLGRGELLHMANGSIWFHPFSGCKPICETPPTWRD